MHKYKRLHADCTESVEIHGTIYVIKPESGRYEKFVMPVCRKPEKMEEMEMK